MTCNIYTILVLALGKTECALFNCIRNWRERGYMPMITIKSFCLNEIVMKIGHVIQSMLGIKLDELILL